MIKKILKTAQGRGLQYTKKIKDDSRFLIENNASQGTMEQDLLYKKYCHLKILSTAKNKQTPKPS